MAESPLPIGVWPRVGELVSPTLVGLAVVGARVGSGVGGAVGALVSPTRVGEAVDGGSVGLCVGLEASQLPGCTTISKKPPLVPDTSVTLLISPWLVGMNVGAAVGFLVDCMSHLLLAVNVPMDTALLGKRELE